MKFDLWKEVNLQNANLKSKDFLLGTSNLDDRINEDGATTALMPCISLLISYCNPAITNASMIQTRNGKSAPHGTKLKLSMYHLHY
jgi:hypothetical protein